MSDGEFTARKHRGLREPWQRGQSGNPAGRPKGARNKLGEAFIADLYADWAEHGVEAIETVRQERPQDYLKIVASILPRDLNVRVNEFDGWSDEDIEVRLRTLANYPAIRDFIADCLGADVPEGKMN